MTRKSIVWLLVVSALFFLFGCNQQNASNQNTPDVSAGPEQTYQNNCASCHGQNLEGGLGPGLQKIGSKLSKEEIATIIEKGKDSMPSQPQVTAQAREKLAEWLAAKK